MSLHLYRTPPSNEIRNTSDLKVPYSIRADPIYIYTQLYTHLFYCAYVCEQKRQRNLYQIYIALNAAFMLNHFKAMSFHGSPHFVNTYANNVAKDNALGSAAGGGSP